MTTTANNESNSSRKGKRSWISEFLGGEMLMNDVLRRNWKYCVMLIVLTLIYVDSRYECEQQLIEVERLKVELTDARYDALTRSSELMERSRQSKIEEFIEKKQIDLQIATSAPYLIK